MDIVTKSLAAVEPDGRLGGLIFFHPVSDFTIPPKEPAASVGTYSRVLELLVKRLRLLRGRDPSHDVFFFVFFPNSLFLLKLVLTSVHVIAIAVEFHFGIAPVSSNIQPRFHAH
jgi:hypothetical protein